MGKNHLATLVAPLLHGFKRDVPAFDQVVGSFSLTGVQKR